MLNYKDSAPVRQSLLRPVHSQTLLLVRNLQRGRLRQYDSYLHTVRFEGVHRAWKSTGPQCCSDIFHRLPLVLKYPAILLCLNWQTLNGFAVQRPHASVSHLKGQSRQRRAIILQYLHLFSFAQSISEQSNFFFLSHLRQHRRIRLKNINPVTRPLFENLLKFTENIILNRYKDI